MRDVVQVLRTMGSEQLFFALVFLAGYSLAIGEFATARGRLVASGTALVAAAAFAASSVSWPAAVMLLGFALVGVALFSATAWLLWAGAMRGTDAPLQAAPENAARAFAAASSRSRKTAPILNSPAAE